MRCRVKRRQQQQHRTQRNTTIPAERAAGVGFYATLARCAGPCHRCASWPCSRTSEFCATAGWPSISDHRDFLRVRAVHARCLGRNEVYTGLWHPPSCPNVPYAPWYDNLWIEQCFYNIIFNNNKKLRLYQHGLRYNMIGTLSSPSAEINLLP